MDTPSSSHSASRRPGGRPPGSSTGHSDVAAHDELTHLRVLEAEAIHIMREVAAEL